MLERCGVVAQRGEAGQVGVLLHVAHADAEGLKFLPETPVSSASGGEKRRAALAKLMAEAPELMLLDEPTNHLDIEARNWLEDYLNSYPHAFILISHDRYFLDVTVKKIVEIWNRKVHFYPGNYEKYQAQKAERIAQICLVEFGLEWVKVTVNKPGAIRNSRDVGVMIERHRKDLES